jgi:hypothetical protein
MPTLRVFCPAANTREDRPELATSVPAAVAWMKFLRVIPIIFSSDFINFVFAFVTQATLHHLHVPW